jgi:hypothetical protein
LCFRFLLSSIRWGSLKFLAHCKGVVLTALLATSSFFALVFALAKDLNKSELSRFKLAGLAGLLEIEESFLPSCPFLVVDVRVAEVVVSLRPSANIDLVSGLTGKGGGGAFAPLLRLKAFSINHCSVR